MVKTPKTTALLREMWRQYRAGKREHPLDSWVSGSEWKHTENRCECGQALFSWQKLGELCPFCEAAEMHERVANTGMNRPSR